MKIKLILSLSIIGFCDMKAADDSNNPKLNQSSGVGQSIEANLLDLGQDSLSLVLDNVPGENLWLNEIARQTRLNHNVYDKIVESFLKKIQAFYIEESDIDKIVKTHFKMSHEGNFSSKKFHEEIVKAFKRYIEKYPYGKLCKHIRNMDLVSFQRELNASLANSTDALSHCNFNVVNSKVVIDANNFLNLRNFSDTERLEFVESLKKEQQVIKNLLMYFELCNKQLSLFNKIKKCICMNEIGAPSTLKQNLAISGLTTTSFFVSSYFSVIISKKLNLGDSEKLKAFTKLTAATYSCYMGLSLLIIFKGFDFLYHLKRNNIFVAMTTKTLRLKKLDQDIQLLIDEIKNKQ